MLLKNLVFDVSTLEKSGNIGGVNYMPVHNLNENRHKHVQNATLNSRNFLCVNIDATFGLKLLLRSYFSGMLLYLVQFDFIAMLSILPVCSLVHAILSHRLHMTA